MPSMQGSLPGERRGGRKKGTPNKRTSDMARRAAALGMLPHELLAAIARGDEIDGIGEVTTEQRIQCAVAAAPYYAAKKREVTGPNGGLLSIVDYSKMSLEQLAALEPVLLALAGG